MATSTSRRFRWLIILLGVPIATIGITRLIIALLPPQSSLGVGANGQLAMCPDKPNCVCSQAKSPDHAIAPIYRAEDESPQEAIERLALLVRSLPRTRVVTLDDNYLHAEFRSRWFGFVDDVEFFAPEDEQVVHFRSASRIGHSDLGVNRERMEFLATLASDVTIN